MNEEVKGQGVLGTRCQYLFADVLRVDMFLLPLVAMALPFMALRHSSMVARDEVDAPDLGSDGRGNGLEPGVPGRECGLVLLYNVWWVCLTILLDRPFLPRFPTDLS